jgi:hypothetical protein
MILEYHIRPEFAKLAEGLFRSVGFNKHELEGTLIMQEGEIELLRQPSRCLMYVGDIPGVMSSKKRPIPCIPQLSIRRLPLMISQPIPSSGMAVISILRD